MSKYFYIGSYLFILLLFIKVEKAYTGDHKVADWKAHVVEAQLTTYVYCAWRIFRK